MLGYGFWYRIAGMLRSRATSKAPFAFFATSFSCVALVCVTLASSAVAQGAGACAVGGGPTEYQIDLTPFIEWDSNDPGVDHNGRAAARAALGSQFGMLWYSDQDQGWDVGLAPGPLNVVEGRAAIVGHLATLFSIEEVDYLAGLLNVYELPYGESELLAVQSEILNEIDAASLSIAFSVDPFCDDDGVIRVLVSLPNDSSPEEIAAVESIVAPHGDIARVLVSDTGGPGPSDLPADDDGALPPNALPPPMPRLDIADFVEFKYSKRCSRKPIVVFRVHRSKLAELASLSVRVVGHRPVTIRSMKLAKTFRIRLKSFKTRIRLTATITDGRTVSQTIVVTRCK